MVYFAHWLTGAVIHASKWWFRRKKNHDVEKGDEEGNAGEAALLQELQVFDERLTRDWGPVEEQDFAVCGQQWLSRCNGNEEEARSQADELVETLSDRLHFKEEDEREMVLSTSAGNVLERPGDNTGLGLDTKVDQDLIKFADAFGITISEDQLDMPLLETCAL